MAATAAAMFLPWQTAATDSTGAVRGISVDEGQIVLVVSLATIALIQVGWRPAWIGAGFTLAITVREILDLSGGGTPDPALGLWGAAVTALVVVALLVWDLFAHIGQSDDDSTADGGQGLSGPLGKRQS